MSKSSKKPSVSNPGDGVPEPDKRTPLERAAEESEQKIVDMLQREEFGDAVVELSRRAVTSAVFAHLTELPVRGFTQENVRKVFGGGDYKAKVRKQGGGWGPQFQFSIDHSIPSIYPNGAKKEEAKPEDRTPELVTAITAAIKSSLPPPAPPPDNALTLELIRQGGESTKAMIQIFLANRAPGVDPNVAALMESVRSLRDEIKELKHDANSGGRGKSSLSTVREVLELQDLLGGGGGGGGDGAPVKPDRIGQLIEHFGPVAAAVMMKMMNVDPGQATPEQLEQMRQAQLSAGQQPLLPAAAMPPNAAATPSPAPTAQPVTDMNPLFKIYLVEFRRVAIQAAARGRDALDWADNKIDEIDAKYHEQIFALANKETWFAEFFGSDPAATNHFQWLQDMRNMILTRWFVADAVKAYGATPRAEPDAYAAAFLDRASVSYHDHLWNLTDISEDPKAWEEIFFVTDPKTKEQIVIDSVWLESLRVAFEKILDPKEEEKPAAPPPPPPPATPAKTGQAAGKKTATAPKAGRGHKKAAP